MCNNHNINRIVLSDEGVRWVETNGMPIMSKNFLGYLIRVNENDCCYVGLDNSLIPASSNEKKPEMTKRRAAKIFKELEAAGFLRDSSLDPFPEMEMYNGIKFDPDRAFRIDGNLMERKFAINADDDLSGIEEFFPEESISS